MGNREVEARYREAHREQINARKRLWHAENRERVNARRRGKVSRASGHNPAKAESIVCLSEVFPVDLLASHRASHHSVGCRCDKCVRCIAHLARKRLTGRKVRPKPNACVDPFRQIPEPDKPSTK